MLLRERFEAKFTPEPTSGCWLWTAGGHPTGYGRFGLSAERVEFAHRASWIIYRGPIPAGLYVCHHCDVRMCVNPAHLFLGTAKDNMRDASRKGRVVVPRESFESNEQHQVSILSDAQVREIRASPLNAKDLFRTGRYPVSYESIWQAKSGRTFRSVAP